MGAVSDADYKPCPHCGRELHKWSRRKHIAACPQRPEIAQRLREALTDVDGYAVIYDAYIKRAAGTNLPGATTLIKHFGSWGAAAAHFGLTPRSEAQHNQCPHCRRSYTNIRQHALACPQRPEIADALRAALTSVEDGCLVARDEYGDIRTPDLPHPHVLSAHFGGWANVAAHFGLPVRSREEAHRRRGHAIRRGWAMRREGSTSVQDDPLLVGAVRVREDYGEFDGLPVQGVRQLAGGGVAYMLR